MSNLKLGRFFSFIKIGYNNNNKYVVIPYTKYYYNIVILLFRERYINSFVILKNNIKYKYPRYIKIYLKYFEDRPVIRIVVYNKFKFFKSNFLCFKKGRFFFNRGIGMTNGLVVYSTTKGLMKLEDCLISKINGKFLFFII